MNSPRHKKIKLHNDNINELLDDDQFSSLSKKDDIDEDITCHPNIYSTSDKIKW